MKSKILIAAACLALSFGVSAETFSGVIKYVKNGDVYETPFKADSRMPISVPMPSDIRHDADISLKIWRLSDNSITSSWAIDVRVDDSVTATTHQSRQLEQGKETYLTNIMSNTAGSSATDLQVYIKLDAAK